MPGVSARWFNPLAPTDSFNNIGLLAQTYSRGSLVAEALGPDQATMMWVGTVLGFRWAECAGMTTNRIDFGAGTVSVDRQLSRSGTLAPPKSASSTRTLACPKWLMDDLAALVDRRGVGKSSDELVFVTRDDRPLDYTNWRRRIWLPA